MVKLADESVFDKLDQLDSTLENCSCGVKLSQITEKLKGTINFMPLLGKFQQLGFVKIIYDPSRDDEPLVQITEKGKQQAIELLCSLQHTG